MQIASLEVRSPIKIHIEFGLFAKHAQNFQNSRNIADVLHPPLVFETTVTIIWKLSIIPVVWIVKNLFELSGAIGSNLVPRVLSYTLGTRLDRIIKKILTVTL